MHGNPSSDLDAQFRKAVAAMDAGNMDTLEEMLRASPELACARLDAPGAWLRDVAGDALDGFFQRPYLLWFVAEDPVRNGKLPPNIADVTRAIIRAAQRQKPETMQEQLDYALRLVCWSWIARECEVQIPFIDVLVEAGAALDGSSVYEGRYGTHSDSAIYNGNFAAAERLVALGAPVTLSTALCLRRWADVDRLAAAATPAEKEDAFVLAARNGLADSVRRMLALGMNPTTVSAQNQSHATALHHAVWSGSLDTVRALVKAGADLHRRDTIYDATPRGWAEYCGAEEEDAAKAQRLAEIAGYLREQSNAAT